MLGFSLLSPFLYISTSPFSPVFALSLSPSLLPLTPPPTLTATFEPANTRRKPLPAAVSPHSVTVVLRASTEEQICSVSHHCKGTSTVASSPFHSQLLHVARWKVNVTRVPGLPAFQRATLKMWEWAWGQGYSYYVYLKTPP